MRHTVPVPGQADYGAFVGFDGLFHSAGDRVDDPEGAWIWGGNDTQLRSGGKPSVQATTKRSEEDHWQAFGECKPAKGKK